MRSRPYGEWASPLSAEALAASSLRLQAVVAGDGHVAWIEGRPGEAGRQVLVRAGADGVAHDLLPAPWSARTRINEYGGRPFYLAPGRAWFSNDADQRVYELRLDAAQDAPRALTPASDARYGDLVLDAGRARLLAVREQMPAAGHESTHALVAIALDGSQQVTVLHEGEDFYGSVALAPDARSIAWLTWQHPNMPWDRNTLWHAALHDDGVLRAPRRLSEGDALAHFQPQFSPAGELFVVADAHDWWNLHRVDVGSAGGLHCIHEAAAEFGLPQWVGGMSTYAFLDAEQLICARCERGQWRLGVLDLARGDLRDLDTGFTQFGSLSADGHAVAFLGGSPSLASSVVRYDVDSGAALPLRASAPPLLDSADIAVPEVIEYPTGAGVTSQGLLYLPRNQHFEAPPGELPPLIVISHGGPTGAASAVLNPSIQYWTTRGFALLDVNYRGSTGFGRAYREALYGEWGVADVEDCARGAQALVVAGRVDGERLIIRGGSAGGFTTLAALAFTDVFKAGASYYGVSDLELLACETHKFESRYLDQLVGPYPEAKSLYEQRAPVNHAQQINVPVLFLQGLEDKVVPPNQAETMVAALERGGVPVAYVPFEGEQHGFRRAASVRRAHECELAFYGRVFGFAPAGELPALEVSNLPD